MLVVGSTALKHYGVNMARKPSDVDIIATRDSVEKWLKHNTDFIGKLEHKTENKTIAFMKNREIVEFEIASEELNPTALTLLETYASDSNIISYAVPEVVLALKLSHRYLKNNPHFRKTMDDILALRGMGFKVPESLAGEWMKNRQKWTYNYKHPSLNQGKKSFFSGDGVDYKYEHDDIHAALAVLPEPHETNIEDALSWGQTAPAYKYFQADGAEVKTDKSKFFALPENIKRLSVLEESYVLALERSQIPNNFCVPPRTSFLIALEKVCTSITSGWWREYAWENYYKVLAMYSDDYVLKFRDALSQGKIRPYQGGEHM